MEVLTWMGVLKCIPTYVILIDRDVTLAGHQLHSSQVHGMTRQQDQVIEFYSACHDRWRATIILIIFVD